MENMENPESVKSIAETKLKMYLIINTQSYRDKEFLQIFLKSLQFACKFKINILIFHTFHKFIYGKTRVLGNYLNGSVYCSISEL